MTKRKYLLRIPLILIALILPLLFWPGLILAPSSLLDVSELALPGLRQPVTVHYDAQGMPHISAENEHDLFYAAGYVMASERLFQMDMVNRAVQGRLAEMSAGLVNSDKFLRTWGFHHIAKQLVDEMDDDSRQIIEWSCAGINAYIETHKSDLPPEFTLAGHEPLLWEPATVAGFARLMGRDMNNAQYAEMLMGRIAEVFGGELMEDLLPAYPDTKPYIVPPGVYSYASMLDPLLEISDELAKVFNNTSGFSGSNSWVVSGEKTETGLPLLANDPHLSFGQPMQWYEMHLTGGRFNVRGVCLPGIPLAIIGHNDHISWGMTNVMTDDMDFYEEIVNPDDSTQYLYKGEWLPFEVRHEVINVKGKEPVEFTVRSTIHGVIINDFNTVAKLWDKPVAMRWTGQDITRELDAIVKLNLAANWDEFSEAARLFDIPGQNVIYADREGNIGWRPFVALPKRREGSGMMIMPGSTGEWDWQGMIPDEEMPYLYNPPSGYIVTANNKTIGPEFPHFISAYWAPPARAERIKDLIEASDKHSIETFMAIQYDDLSLHARDVMPYLMSAYKGVEVEGLLAEALGVMAAWDYRMPTESAAAALYNIWYLEMIDGIYRDEMDGAGAGVYKSYNEMAGMLPLRNIPRLLAKGGSLWFDNINTEVIEWPDDIIRGSFENAVARLGAQFGTNMSAWEWGKIHTITHKHDLGRTGKLGKFLDWMLDLNIGPFPFPGAQSTVNPGNYNFSKPFDVTGGSSFRKIIDLSNWDNSKIIFPTGQSGNPFSEHYGDQAEMFMSGQYRQIDFSREAVEANAKHTLVLKP